jgi:hypothetical protein
LWNCDILSTFIKILRIYCPTPTRLWEVCYIGRWQGQSGECGKLERVDGEDGDGVCHLIGFETIAMIALKRERRGTTKIIGKLCKM